VFSFGNASHRSADEIPSSKTAEIYRTRRQASTKATFSGTLNIVGKAGKLLSLIPAESAAWFSAHMFPNTTIHLYQNRELWYSISLLPLSPTRTIVKCEVYQTLPVSAGIQTSPEIEASAVKALQDHLHETIHACEERQSQLQDNMYIPLSYGIASGMFFILSLVWHITLTPLLHAGSCICKPLAGHMMESRGRTGLAVFFLCAK
jgi:hypothetical protein